MQDNAVVVNRLAQSSSPYLVQHAHNPVNWWEWSPEAFAQARERDVPIFLSIGYSACHWCHVMAHESFENPEIADYVNAHFVSIKVDREERPDIDSIYMEATVALTGHGGWPMSVFMDADGKPFYAGTYFPPQPRHGLPSFGQLLISISEAWNQRRTEVQAAGQRIIDALNRQNMPITGVQISDMPVEDALSILRNSVRSLEGSFDPRNGGFGGSPKFPPSMVLEFLLRMSLDPEVGASAELMANKTLDAMARGGLYDQLRGGFARYSVDAQWVVPHFEKMLYDNALLIRVYAHWWRLTGSPLARRVVRESIEFLTTELLTDQGAFASALDADSEGEEGKFYAWSPAEIAEVIPPEKVERVTQLFSVTTEGTFEGGKSTLQLLEDPRDSPDGKDFKDWEEARTLLALAQDARVRPGRDDKVVASWNGLAIAALSEAGAIFDQPQWIESATKCAEYLVQIHFQKSQSGDPQSDSRTDALFRTSLHGIVGRHSGVLDDYANVAEGFLSLYEVTGEDRWLEHARTLTRSAVEHFSDETGGFFDTADDSEQLVRRPRSFSDNAEPSGWLALANVLVRLGTHPDVYPETNNRAFRERAEQALGVLSAVAADAPRAVGWGLVALWSLVQGPWEVTVSGENSRTYADIAMRSPLAVEIRWDRDLPSGAQVCRGNVCEFPTEDQAALSEFLKVGIR